MPEQYRSEDLVDPKSGDSISAYQARLQNELLRRSIGLPDSISDSIGTRQVKRRTSSPFRIYTCELTADLNSGSSATAKLLTGVDKTTDGGEITVYDTPAFITSGKKLATGTLLRVFKDHDMVLAADEYVLLTPKACEVDQ